jgi:hypothetical protein
MARLLIKDLVYDLGVYKGRLESSEREVARLTGKMREAANSLDVLSRENSRLRKMVKPEEVSALKFELAKVREDLSRTKHLLAKSERTVTVLLHETLKQDKPSVLSTEGISSGATLRLGREHQFIETYLL